jgi:hypothetical protein
MDRSVVGKEQRSGDVQVMVDLVDVGSEELKVSWSLANR